MIQQFHFWIYNPKEIKTGYQIDIFTLMFTVALFTVAKIWKLEPINDEWIKKI